MEQKRSFKQAVWSEQAPYHRLPVELTPLIGREREVDMICDLLTHPEVRLLTLLGPGGVGKTRLGLHVAIHMQQHFSDGVYFVPLTMIKEPNLVIPAFAQALQLQESGGIPLFEQIQIALQDRRTLVLLDNFEHVVQTAPLLESLLIACPSLKILVTSREVLHLRAEQQFPVPPFPLPDLKQLASEEDLLQNPSVALFLQRAQSIVPTFHLSSTNARAIAEICIRLDGLPLALELAAARIKTLSPQALLARLTQRLQLLTGGPRTLPERQQTLRNTLKWSYDLLEPQEQWLYRLLSVFVGGYTLEAVEAVVEALTGNCSSLLDTVTALVDKCLLVPIEQEGEEPRFVMLETVREYGLECLRERGEFEVSQQAHACYYLTLAEQGNFHLKGGGQQSLWLKRLTQSQANLRAAFSWFLERQDAESALRLGGALWWYWTMRGSRLEALEWLKTALQLPGAEKPTVARAKALCGAGFLSTYQHDRGQEGIALLRESLSLYQRLDDKLGLAEVFGWFAQVQIYLKDYGAARSLAEQGVTLSQISAGRRFVAFNHSMLSLVIEKQGDEAEALAYWEQSLALARELDEQAGLVTRALRHLALLALARGDYGRARTLLEEKLSLARESGNPGATYWSLSGLADLARLQGDHAQATALCAEGLALARETVDYYAISRLLSTQGNVAQEQGDHEQAVACFREGLSLAAKISAEEIIGLNFLGLAREALSAGQWEQATRLFAATTNHLTINRRLAPTERAAYERDLAHLRTQLDTTTFAAAWAAGQIMTPQQALALSYVHKYEQMPAHDSNHPRLSKRPDGLTAREVEVLCLVAQGWTDAQIAESLVISPRTVNAHLTSIYRKIRVSSRYAATHYALQRQLTDAHDR